VKCSTPGPRAQVLCPSAELPRGRSDGAPASPAARRSREARRKRWALPTPQPAQATGKPAATVVTSPATERQSHRGRLSKRGSARKCSTPGPRAWPERVSCRCIKNNLISRPRSSDKGLSSEVPRCRSDGAPASPASRRSARHGEKGGRCRYRSWRRPPGNQQQQLRQVRAAERQSHRA